MITLGSPFAVSPKATNAWRVYEMASGRSAEEEDQRFGGALAGAPPVPTTAIFSRTDGICAWQGCMEKTRRHPRASRSKAAIAAWAIIRPRSMRWPIAWRRRKAQWTPFDRSGWRSLVYPIRIGSATRFLPGRGFRPSRRLRCALLSDEVLGPGRA